MGLHNNIMAIFHTTMQLLTILYMSDRVMCAVDDKLKCTDWNNRYIDDGQEFYPKREDPCYVCICNKGYTERCKSVRCTAPTEPCDRYVPVEGACCEFKCLDKKTRGGGKNATTPVDTGSEDGSSDSITTLGLRLVASTVTSFLVLALLLFMVHRIRQRRLMLAMRRYHNSRRRDELDDYDHDGFTQEYLGIHSPPPYEDPPPPYSPPKPPQHVLPSESPPPYESVDDNSNIYNNNNNNDIHCQTEHNEMMPNNNQNFISLHCNDMNNQSLDNKDVTVVPSDHNIGRTRSLSPCSDNISDCISQLSDISESCTACNPRSGCSVLSYRPSLSAFHMNTINRESNRHVNSVRLQSPLSGLYCNQHNIPVLDRLHDPDITDDSSSHVSDSFTLFPRRPHQNNFHTLQRYISQCPRDGTDSDNLSTELSLDVLPTQPIRNHAENVLSSNLYNFEERHKPIKISYIDGQKNYMSHHNIVSNKTIGNNVNCSHGNVNNIDGHSDVNSSGIINKVDSEVCEGPLYVQDVSLSDLCSSSLACVPSKVCADTKQLQEVHLCNLFGQSCESSERPVTAQVFNRNIPRSQSDVSMFSLCSETGEKKLSQTAGTTLKNDAQYPDSIYKGRQSLAMSVLINQKEFGKMQLNQNEETLQRFDNTKLNLKNSESQKDREEMMGGKVHTCDEGRNVLLCEDSGHIRDKNNTHDINNKNTCNLSDQFNKKGSLSECSNSSSEKNCTSDSKFLIKSLQKNANRKTNSKKDTMRNSVMTQRKKNKHIVHRHSSGSLSYMKQRVKYIDAPENDLFSPFDQTKQVSKHKKNQTKLFKDSQSSNIQQKMNEDHNISSTCEIGTSFVLQAKSKKKPKITTKTNTIGYSKANKTLNSGKKFCNLWNDKSPSVHINSTFSTVENPIIETMPGKEHLFDQHLSPKSGKSKNDASFLCPAGKGFNHWKNRNSKQSKNRKSCPSAIVTETNVKEINLVPSSIVSYNVVKKETEFSSDGVKEKLTFHDGNDMLKHADLNEELYRIEKCSYV